MDEPEKEVENEEIIPPFHFITMVIDPEMHSPQIDLGQIPPHAAIVFFRQAAQALEDLLCPPTITFDGQVIYDAIQDEG